MADHRGFSRYHRTTTSRERRRVPSVSSCCKDLLALLASRRSVKKLNKLSELYLEAIEKEALGEFWMSHEQLNLLETFAKTKIESDQSSVKVLAQVTREKVAEVVKSWMRHDQMLLTEAKKQARKQSEAQQKKSSEAEVPTTKKNRHESPPMKAKVEVTGSRKHDQRPKSPMEDSQKKPRYSKSPTKPEQLHLDRDQEPAHAQNSQQHALRALSAKNNNFWSNFYAKTMRTRKTRLETHARNKNNENSEFSGNSLKPSEFSAQPPLPPVDIEKSFTPPLPKNSVEENQEDDEVVLVTSNPGTASKKMNRKRNDSQSSDDDIWMKIDGGDWESGSKVIRSTDSRKDLSTNRSEVETVTLSSDSDTSSDSSSSSCSTCSSCSSTSSSSSSSSDKSNKRLKLQKAAEKSPKSGGSQQNVVTAQKNDRSMALVIDKASVNELKTIVSTKRTPDAEKEAEIAAAIQEVSPSNSIDEPHDKLSDSILEMNSNCSFMIEEVRSISQAEMQGELQTAAEESVQAEEDAAPTSMQCEHESDFGSDDDTETTSDSDPKAAVP